MKKNIITKFSGFFILVLLFSISACDKDDDNVSSESNHRVVYTSEMNFDNKIEVNGDMSFGDISTGVNSRTWTFPAGVSNIDMSSEAIVNAIFNQVGQHDVTLHQVFGGDAYVGEELMGRELDTTIVVTVLEPVNVSVQAFQLNDDDTLGAELNMSDDAENEVTASKRVQFVYSVDGQPDVFNWTFEGGDPATYEGAEPEVNVKYRSVGTYDMQFIASRARPFGGDTLQFNNLIKVIPSTDPVNLDGISDKEGKIALEFSRDMDPFTLNKDHFSVTIENGTDLFTPMIANAEVDSDSGNVVLLTLDNESIYNDDIIKVSYTPGTLSTLDAVAATAFTDEVLTFNIVNVLNGSDFDYSFENTTNANWPLAWGSSGVWNITSDQAQDGNSSAYVELPPNAADGFTWVQHVSNGEQNKVAFQTGKTYEIGAWVYVVDNGNTTGFAPDIRFYWKGTGDYDWSAPPVAILSDGMPVGQWVYGRQFITFAEDTDYEVIIRGWNNQNLETVKFYIDNISVSEVSLRP